MLCDALTLLLQATVCAGGGGSVNDFAFTEFIGFLQPQEMKRNGRKKCKRWCKSLH